MPSGLIRSLSVLLVLLACAGTARAEAPRTPCDDLAAHPADADRVAPGVYWEVLDGLAASAACEQAVKRYPESLRLSFQLGRALIRMKRRDEGFPYLYDAATRGYLIAQATLGGFYQWDLGDVVEAERWYRIGAEGGSVSAMAHLGDMFAAGNGVGRDYAQAYRWYRQAALKGYALAENNLGWFNEEGYSVERDYEKAIRWYRRAALKGFARAQFNVGRMYEHGRGVDANSEKAFEWYTRAALQGYAYAELRLGELMEHGGAGLRPDRKEALYWYRRAQRAREDEVVADARAGAARALDGLAAYEIAEVDARLAVSRQLAPDETVAALQPAGEQAAPAATPAALPGPVVPRPQSRPQSRPAQSAPTVAPATASAIASAPAPAPAAPAEKPLDAEYVVVAAAALLSDASEGAKAVGSLLLGDIVTAEAEVSATARIRVAREGKPIGYVDAAKVLPVGSRDAVAALSRALREQAAKASAPAAAAPKDVAEGAPLNLGRYHALVIGANDYQNLPKLVSAVADAHAVAEVLEKLYGFKVQKLINPSRRDIVIALDRLRQNLEQEDNLLVYYAGHGSLDHAAGRGFWLPVEASEETMVDWVSTATITDTLRAAVAKHVILVVDSCYSGSLTRGVKIEGPQRNVMEALAGKRARVVLTSGGLEPVTDSGGSGGHSVFATAFLDALKENTGVLTGADLFSRIRRPIMLNAEQTPEYGDIRLAGHEGGDFLFARVN